MSFKLHTVIVILSATLALASCSTSRRGTPRATVSPRQPGRELTVPPTTDLSSHSRALVEEARSWLGTPYKYGGNDRAGVDCSGLVLQVYSKALDISVPRNSRAQKDFCTPASRGSLIPGDLVFFATGKQKDRVSHVGIFVGENRMIHASASKGVIVSDLSEGYYSRTFAGAGYVETYHAMLDKNSKKGKKRKPSKPSKSEAVPVTEPLPDPSATEIASARKSSGITLTPVSSLPVRNAVNPQAYDDDDDGLIRPVPEAEPEYASEPEPEVVTATTRQAQQDPAPAVTPAPTPVPVKAVQATATAPASASEPTPGDARSAVLGSITEKPLQ